jgi:AMMECR1 domain-containing protein
MLRDKRNTQIERMKRLEAHKILQELISIFIKLNNKENTQIRMCVCYTQNLHVI